MVDFPVPKRKRDIVLNLVKKKMPFVRKYAEPCGLVISNITELVLLNSTDLATSNHTGLNNTVTVFMKLKNFKSPFQLRKKAFYLITNSSIGRRIYRAAEGFIFVSGNFSELVTSTNQVAARSNNVTDFVSKVGTGLPGAISISTGIVYAGKYMLQRDFFSAIGMTTSVVCEGASCVLILSKSDYGLGKILIPISGFAKNLVKIKRNIEGDPVTLKQLSGFNECFVLPIPLPEKNNSNSLSN